MGNSFEFQQLERGYRTTIPVQGRSGSHYRLSTPWGEEPTTWCRGETLFLHEIYRSSGASESWFVLRHESGETRLRRMVAPDRGGVATTDIAVPLAMWEALAAELSTLEFPLVLVDTGWACLDGTLSRLTMGYSQNWFRLEWGDPYEATLEPLSGWVRRVSNAMDLLIASANQAEGEGECHASPS